MFIKKQKQQLSGPSEGIKQGKMKKETFWLKKVLIYSVFVIFLLNIAFFSLAAPIVAQTEKIAKNSEEITNNVADLFNKVSKKNTIYQKLSDSRTISAKNREESNDFTSLNQELYNNIDNFSEIKVAYSSYHTLSAYNSLPNQTDDSPCITANNFNVCDHNVEDTIAANFLKFNTKVRIPELFGNRVFIVRDRMNRRYANNVDIWMKDYSDAKKFGRRVAKIEVLE